MNDDADAKPVRRALVSLTPADGARGSISQTVVSDDDGRFVFQGIAAGRYTLSADKPGYVKTAFGARRPGRPGTPVQVSAGPTSLLTIRMPRGAVITGTVTDARGEPLPSARVVLMINAYSTQNGERTIQPTGFSATSDDRGTYRIFGITPGEYIAQLSPPFALPGDLRQTTDRSLQAAMQQLRAPAGAPVTAPTASSPPIAYAPVYFPGTTIATSAGILRLVAGEERAGVDLQSLLVPTAKIEGTVIGSDGLPAASAQVTLLGASADNSMSMMMGAMFGGRPDAEGRFTLSNVAPGHYTVAARTGTPGRGTGAAAVMSTTTLWATAEVDVNGQDIGGLRLTLEPGVRVSGRMTFAGAGDGPVSNVNVPTLSVMLNPLLSGSSVASVTPPAQTDGLGAFSFASVTPGRYRLAAAGLPPPWVLKSATAGGRELLDSGLIVRGGEPIADVVLSFSTLATTLTGTFADATGRPAPEYFIIVYSSDRAFWAPPSRRVVMTRPGNDGTFAVRGLPPGDYFIAAVTDVEQNEWMDPAFLEPLVSTSIKVSLADGQTKTQDIRIAGR